MSKKAFNPRGYGVTAVEFSRLPRRGILLGLSVSQLVVVGIAAVALVLALYSGGAMSLLYASPLLLCCAAVGLGQRGREEARAVGPNRWVLGVAIQRWTAPVPSPHREAPPHRSPSPAR